MTFYPIVHNGRGYTMEEWQNRYNKNYIASFTNPTVALETTELGVEYNYMDPQGTEWFMPYIEENDLNTDKEKPLNPSPSIPKNPPNAKFTNPEEQERTWINQFMHEIQFHPWIQWEDMGILGQQLIRPQYMSDERDGYDKFGNKYIFKEN